MPATAQMGAEPVGYLKAQTRWGATETLFWLATLLPFYFLPDYLQLASQIAIIALFALSLDLILGYAGIVSLGHAAFFGTGAYAAGLFSKFVWGEPLTGLIVGRDGGRPRRLCDQLHHRALPPFHSDHADARLWLAAGRRGE